MKLRATVEHHNGVAQARLRAYLAGEEFSQGLGKEPVNVEIYRKEAPEFQFNADYSEYFDGFKMDDATVIFSGPLAAINGRKLEYFDMVPTGRTYAYQIRLQEGKKPPTGPVFVRARDERVWWPYRKVEQRLRELALQHPRQASLESYGATAQGRPILGLRAGNRLRSIALVGLIHAGESGPELLIPALERLLAEESALLDQVGVALLPAVNIDERERQVEGAPEYLRTNSRGVDLNRNFPSSWETVDHSYGLISSDPDAITYRGPFAASESETVAVMEFIQQVQPSAIFSTHCLASICSATFLTARSAEDDNGYRELCNRWLTPYTEGYYRKPDHPVALKYACSAGSLPEWAYRNGKIPCFDLEWDRAEATRPCLHDGTTPEMVEECAGQHYEGLRRTLAHAALELKR